MIKLAHLLKLKSKIRENSDLENANCLNWLKEIVSCFNAVMDSFKETFLNEKPNLSTLETWITNTFQIFACLKYIESASRIERIPVAEKKIICNYFRDRILQNVDQLILNIKEKDKKIMEPCCFKILDDLYDTIELYSRTEDPCELAESIRVMSTTDKDINCQISSLLSEILAYSAVAMPSDRDALNALCKRVLKESQVFDNELKFYNIRRECNNYKVHLSAVLLESALSKLEECMGVSMLRVFYKLHGKKASLAGDVRLCVQSGKSKEAINEAILNFDINMERIRYLGLMAIEYAEDIKARCMIASCLLSFELLKCDLIVSIQCSSNFHSLLLEEHFQEEIDNFFFMIQKLIDTKELCKILLEDIDQHIKKNEGNLKRSVFHEMVKKGEVFKENVRINANELKIFENEVVRQKYMHFCTILDECKAILNCFQQVEIARIVKRFRLLKFCASSLLYALNETKEKETKEFTGDESLLTSTSQNFVISGNQKVEKTYVLPTTSTLSKIYERDTKSTNKKPSMIKRRTSLRRTILKKQCFAEFKDLVASETYNSFSLNITAVLGELTSLSATLS